METSEGTMTDEEPDEQGIYHWGDISQFPEPLKKYYHHLVARVQIV